MSIINEALKKTQTNLNNFKERPATVTDDRIATGQKTWQPPAAQPSQSFTQAPSSGPVATPPPQAKRTSAKRWYLIVAAEILVLGLVAWTLFIMQPQLFQYSQQPTQYLPAIKTRSPAPVPAISVAPEIKYTPPQKNNLTLNGIMMNQGKMVALINGEVYEVGDYIGARRINKMTLDMVELRDGDELTILSVRDQGR